MGDLKPEEIARVWIDQKLEEAGWKVIDRNEFAPNMTAVAIREASMQGGLEADYLLLINGKAAGVLEAKRAEVSLEDPHLIAQAEKYTTKLRPWYAAWELPLKFVWISNGKEIAFKDCHNPDARYEIVTDFPRPKKLVKLMNLDDAFAGLPCLFKDYGDFHLRTCQFEAIQNLESSLRAGKKRALMVLATGSGKTFTACMIAYRLLEYTQANRILFLVDRNNLGINAVTEFQKFTLTETRQAFTELYGVKQLKSDKIGNDTKVVVSTIQRLYSQLSGDYSSYSEVDEDSAFAHKENSIVELPENPRLPTDFFDYIIIDECHRSIYSDWKKVLTYFKNARLIGMTATPIPETEAFFDNNRVADYSLEKSIVDGVNVMCRIYRIKTELSENGGQIEPGEKIKFIGHRGNKSFEKPAIEGRDFTKAQLNRSVIVPDQIRKVLEEYKDVVYKQMFPDRAPNYDYLPKTLIFAASDEHASRVVEIAKKVFNRPDDKFVQRITYSVGDSNRLIREFRTSRDFRIAVTVTLVATGTDIRPLEVLIFLNDVRSETLYTQMKGRGVRTISDEKLREVTPNARSKELFFLVDAVGVTTSEKTIPGLGSREHPLLNPTLEQLFEKMALGVLPDDYFQLLASKLSCIGNRADKELLDEFAKICPTSPCEFAQRIFDALEKGNSLPPYKSSNADNTERFNLIGDLLNNIPARNKLVEIAKGYVKVLDEKTDTVIEADFSVEEAMASTKAFETYIKNHRDEVEALRLIYNNQAGKITSSLMEQLVKSLSNSLSGFSISRLWQDYKVLNPKKVDDLGRSKDDLTAVTNLIQLVRYAYGLIDKLYTLKSIAAQRFELWCGQRQREMQLTLEQKELFRQIARYILQNGGCDFRELRVVMPDVAPKIFSIVNSLEAANEQLFSLTDFLLKVA